MGKSLFWKGVVLGAIAGGALTMLDRDTRENAKSKCRETTESAKYYIKNPDEAVQQVKGVSLKVRTAAQQIGEDVAFLTTTIEDIKTKAIETREALNDPKSEVEVSEATLEGNVRNN
ncbi:MULTISPECIES: YtxH domain-containing protein [Cytobacillus]|uniref:YtxH domain-containing protein n=1 Tax=Cytobacillus TaxID=2675230 RepID=UPI001CD7F56D|nr:YtxH domain-containing protein [Cytobacillus kochii]MCA1024983.1 YtxH domain-containing protein [Cytobacillus kochii]MCM3324081.1 YtxH domain-containing protein [Cytobacillus kochii]MCM3346515.1 YtxH domain-containing protein [Cytobacillus kochii]MDM5206677.1 YtxH domain-containing protein [Cytobacillus kochii]